MVTFQGYQVCMVAHPDDASFGESNALKILFPTGGLSLLASKTHSTRGGR